jgi:hypothetical protein
LSFLVAAALAVAAFVAAPLIAHLLRRGRAKEQVFPPARLVPVARSVAKQRARLEDRVLFALRAAQILALAALGAVPLVRCERLSLARDSGASVALAVVLDDSLSMQSSLPGGAVRWERARRAALELVSSARRGDAVALVLAGKPARVALAPTSDLEAAKRALSEFKVSDRSTDLSGAVQLARGLLSDLPQRDRQLAVFSDFAAEPVPPGAPEHWAPVPELTIPADDCGVASAERKGSRIEALIVCTSGRAAQGRALQAFPGDPLSEPSRDPGSALGSAPLAARGGAQTVTVNVPVEREVLGVRLTGTDALNHDNAAAVGRESMVLAVGVYADPTRASATTGGPTLVEQALAALGEVSVRPLAILPEDPKELAGVAALVLDDPGGLGPEVRRALESFVTRGGVALALLGPRAESREIGSTLEPFAEGALPWDKTDAKGLDGASLAWLGPEAEGLRELAPRGRSRLEGGAPAGSRVIARWSDGRPFLFERELARGLLLTAGLPSSPDESDFALRPAFIALLDHVATLARERSGMRRSFPGQAWRFPAPSDITIDGPSGRLLAREVRNGSERQQQSFTPELAGRYRVRTADGVEERTVSFDPEELGTLPRAGAVAAEAVGRAKRRPEVDASPEAVLLLLGLLSIELIVRIFRLFTTLGKGRATS